MFYHRLKSGTVILQYDSLYTYNRRKSAQGETASPMFWGEPVTCRLKLTYANTFASDKLFQC